MNLLRWSVRAGLALAFGVVMSYGVAWRLEFLQRSRSLIDGLGRTPVGGGSLRWPVPVSGWPEPFEPPAEPTLALRTPGQTGTELRSYLGEAELTTYRVDEFAAGWPFRCVARYAYLREHLSAYPGWPTPDPRPWYGGWHAFDTNDPRLPPPLGTIQIRLPLRPLWAGLAADAGVYGGAMLALWWSTGATRRWVRRRRGLCEVCAYPRRAGAVCPECGLGAPRPPANHGA